MSDAFFSGLYVVQKDVMTNCFGEEVSLLLTGESIPRLSYVREKGEQDKYLGIVSRNDWFHERMNVLLEMSGVQGLAFLDGKSHSHKHESVTLHEGKVVERQTFGYSVLSPAYDEVTAALKQLQQWCLANPTAAADVLEEVEDLSFLADQAYFSLKPSMDGLGDGYGALHAFSVWRTIGDLMRFAKFTNRWVVYRTSLAMAYR